MIKLVFAINIMFMLVNVARSGERVACKAEPDTNGEWHYRTKIPGYAVGIRDDRCWYIGKSMKPRDELYWAQTPARPWELERRWLGEGWEHKE